MGDLHATTEAISTYLTDLQNQVRAPSPPLASVLRVLAEPLHFLGLIETSQRGTHQPTDALPRWAGPGLEPGTNEPMSSSRLHFIQHLLPNHLEFILDHITLDWLSALTTSQQSRLFDASFVPTLGSSRQQPSSQYSWACSVAVMSAQTLVGRLNHQFQENHSFMNQTILRLLRKLLTTYTLPDYHHGALFLSRSKSHHSISGSPSAALSEWTVYWDSFVSKLYSIPTRISNVLGVTGQLGSRSDQELDPCFKEPVFFERQAKQLQHLLERVSIKDEKKIQDKEEKDHESPSCAVVITKYMRLGYGAILVRVMATTLWGVQDSSRAKGWQAALSNCSPGVTQLVLTALVEHFQADRLDFGDSVNSKLTKKSSVARSDQILSPKEQLSRVHKAAQMLVDLGYGTVPFALLQDLHQNLSDNGVMVGRILMQGKVYSLGVLRALVCVQSGWPRGVQATEDSVLFQSFTNVLSIWSDAVFVKHSSIEYQRFISFQLLLMMGYFHSTTLSDPKLGSQISDGMSNWLDLQSFQQKTIALVIGEEFTKAIGSQANFDLNGSDPDIQFARSLVLFRDGARTYDPVPDTVPSEKSQETDDTEPGVDNTDESTVPAEDDDNDEEEDPDAIVPLTRTSVDSDSGSDSDDEDEDDLKPYEMEYESDPDEDASSVRKPKVAAPLYLKDLNRYLRASEDREKAEMGLDKAAELIRRKVGSLELEEYAEMLTTTLIEIQDTFELNGFFKKREDALVALVVTSPILACGVLTFQFYKKGNSIGQRLNILTVLGLGAREISGFPVTASTSGGPSPASASKTHGATAVTSVTKKPATFDSITTDITMDRTRKFSQKSAIDARRSQPKANPFANVAPVVLAGLLGRWGGNRGAGKERGYDAMQRAPAMVLKKFVLTLGLVVYYAGNSPQLILMTRELFRFLLALRYHNPRTTETPSRGGNQGAPASAADSISAMFDQVTTLSTPLTSLKLPETGPTKIGKSNSLSTLDSTYNYNLDLVEAILFDLLILVTPSGSGLSDDILLSEFYPEILEIQNWTMELWDHPQDNQGKSRMYCAAVLQRCFELLKMA
ncbi:telomere binding protein [Podila horticola]|nr:telomere binding protein [Podila horticola]